MYKLIAVLLPLQTVCLMLASHCIWLERLILTSMEDSADCNVLISNSCAAQKPECEVTEVHAFESQNLRYIATPKINSTVHM